MSKAWRQPALLVAVTLGFALFLLQWRFVDTLSEFDSYLTAIGLFDGYGGRGLNSPLHYGIWFSYGYVSLVYAIGRASDFADLATIARLMNAIGYWASVAIVPLVWIATRAAYGARGAWVAAFVFLLSPVFLDVAGGSHQLIPAFALFLGGAALLWSANGRWWLAQWAAAALLLAMSLTIRFEVAFAFPLLILAHDSPVSPVSLVELGRRSVFRLVPTVAALAVFFIARHLLLPPQGNATASFVADYYALSNIPRGVFVALVAFGPATGLAVAALLALRLRRSDDVVPLIGPAAMIAAGLLFWLPNPTPGRHFFFVALGLAMMLGILLRSFPARWWIAGLVVGANVLVAGLAAPYVVRTSAYYGALARPRHIYFAATIDWPWRRRAELKAYMSEALALGHCLRHAPNWRDAVVFSDNLPMLTTAFLDRDDQWSDQGGDAHKGWFTKRLAAPGRKLEIVFRQNEDLALVPRLLAERPAAAFAVDPMSRRRRDVAIPAAHVLDVRCLQ